MYFEGRAHKTERRLNDSLRSLIRATGGMEVMLMEMWNTVGARAGGGLKSEF